MYFSRIIFDNLISIICLEFLFDNLTVDCDVSGSAGCAVQPCEAHTVVAARLRLRDIVKTDLTHHGIVS